MVAAGYELAPRIAGRSSACCLFSLRLRLGPAVADRRACILAAHALNISSPPQSVERAKKNGASALWRVGGGEWLTTAAEAFRLMYTIDLVVGGGCWSTKPCLPPHPHVMRTSISTHSHSVLPSTGNFNFVRSVLGRVHPAKRNGASRPEGYTLSHAPTTPHVYTERRSCRLAHKANVCDVFVLYLVKKKFGSGCVAWMGDFFHVLRKGQARKGEGRTMEAAGFGPSQRIISLRSKLVIVQRPEGACSLRLSYNVHGKTRGGTTDRYSLCPPPPPTMLLIVASGVASAGSPSTRNG